MPGSPSGAHVRAKMRQNRQISCKTIKFRTKIACVLRNFLPKTPMPSTSQPLPAPPKEPPPLSWGAAIALLMLLNVVWGANWPNTKYLVQHIPPFWVVAIRTVLATGIVFLLQLLTRQLVRPPRHDLPVILSTSLLHMAMYGALMCIGLQYINAGQSAVLGYTTPLWVAPAAWFFLKEPMPALRIAGVVLGLLGIAILFDPFTTDWATGNTLMGNGILLFAALIWAVCIIILRQHKWQASPFQLTSWQLLLASCVLVPVAWVVEGPLHVTLTPKLLAMNLYNGVIVTALGFWCMSIINRSLPATTTSLGSLGTPLVGIISAQVFLQEPLEWPLIIGTGMILTGVALGVFCSTEKKRDTPA